ncbi:SulP family inorganic anion transporter [Nocardioides taihuensis]|uniref:SulP family inorganic anion transporter n=1 Tax=Nocardioides taihuensis TaxID=1835606 RepID=A0ABW0BL22_9ACTN
MASAFPSWVAGYRRAFLRGDVLAGVTVTAYLIPQVMAYAEVAGLPAVAGLWAAVASLAAYALLGSSRQLSVGPESTTALMTAAAIGAVAVSGTAGYADLAAALALLVAGLCVLGWIGGLAFLADLLSRPVLVGYMAGVAGIMVVSQLGKITGIEVDADGFVQEIGYVLQHLDQVQLPTLVLALVTLAVMLAGSAVWPRAPMALIGMVGAAAAVALLDLQDRGVAVIGEIPAGLPLPSLPSVSLDGVVEILPAALGVAFVGFTDNILTARAFATRQHDRVDAKRELLALGGANLFSGLMQGFPVSSSGSRTAIVDAVGGRTQLAGVCTLLSTVVAVFALGPLLAAFPQAALGAVVVYAAVRLVDVPEFRRIGRFRRSELLIALATTGAVLVVGVLPGVLVAIGLSVADLMRRVARPHDAVQGFVPDLAGMHDVDDYPTAAVLPGLVVYRYDSPLFFANAEDFRQRALAAFESAQEPVHWFVLNAEAVSEVDVTGVDSLRQLKEHLDASGCELGLARVKQDLRTALAPSGLLEEIGEQRIFPTLPTAVAAYQAWQAEQV